MHPLIEQAIDIADRGLYTSSSREPIAAYQVVCEYSLGDILTGKIECDQAKGLECVYLVTTAELPRPIYIGSTYKGVLRFKDHLKYFQSSFGSVISFLGTECHSWTVSFIHSETHRVGSFRRDETRLIIAFQPYIYGMAWGPNHDEKPEFLKRYEAHFWKPTPLDPVEMELARVRARFGE